MQAPTRQIASLEQRAAASCPSLPLKSRPRMLWSDMSDDDREDENDYCESVRLLGDGSDSGSSGANGNVGSGAASLGTFQASSHILSSKSNTKSHQHQQQPMQNEHERDVACGTQEACFRQDWESSSTPSEPHASGASVPCESLLRMFWSDMSEYDREDGDGYCESTRLGSDSGSASVLCHSGANGGVGSGTASPGTSQASSHIFSSKSNTKSHQHQQQPMQKEHERDVACGNQDACFWQDWKSCSTPSEPHASRGKLHRRHRPGKAKRAKCQRALEKLGTGQDFVERAARLSSQTGYMRSIVSSRIKLMDEASAFSTKGDGVAPESGNQLFATRSVDRSVPQPPAYFGGEHSKAF